MIDKYHQKHADKHKSLVAAETKQRKQWTHVADKKSSKVYADGDADLYAEPDGGVSSDDESGSDFSDGMGGLV